MKITQKSKSTSSEANKNGTKQDETNPNLMQPKQKELLRYSFDQIFAAEEVSKCFLGLYIDWMENKHLGFWMTIRTKIWIFKWKIDWSFAWIQFRCFKNALSTSVETIGFDDIEQKFDEDRYTHFKEYIDDIDKLTRSYINHASSKWFEFYRFSCSIQYYGRHNESPS